MKTCRTARKNVVAFLAGELERAEKERLFRHLESCPGCRREMALVKETLERADSFRPDIDGAMASIDWESLPERIAQAVFEGAPSVRKRPLTEKFWLPLLRWKPVYAGLLVGLLLGLLATIFLFRSSFLDRRGERYFASREFLDRVELEMARRETLDYLNKSQYLLLDFAQASTAEGAFFRSEFASQKARDLLSKKKFLNQQLGKVRMAKAKEICDQIEILFFELTQIGEDLTDEQIREIQTMIEKKSLLLKIKLLKKELEESEV